MRKMKFLPLLLALLTLVGCGRREAEETHVLWVVTEKTAWDGMNNQANKLRLQFQEEHPGFEIKLDILPTAPDARAVYLESLRTPILAGKGPDMFLLPTDTSDFRQVNWTNADGWIGYHENVLRNQRPPLFLDVEQAMYNGLFCDLSAYYDADDELGKDALNTAVMDAGTIPAGDARAGRYLLPLRYNFPALFVDGQGLEALGMTLAEVDTDVMTLLDRVMASGQDSLISGAEPYFLRLNRAYSLLPRLTDFQHGKVHITAEELAAFLRQFQAMEARVGTMRDQRMGLTIPEFCWFWADHEYGRDTNPGTPYNGYFGVKQLFPHGSSLAVGWLDDGMKVAAFSRAEGRPFAMLPLRGMGGGVTACVTYFGAVSGGCQYPKEAYEYLRMFLLEESQWERNRPFLSDIHNRHICPTKRFNLIEAGWPVRINDATDEVWDCINGMAKYQLSVGPRARKVFRAQLKDEDVPLLEAEFDHITFGDAMEQNLTRMLLSLNDPDTGRPTDVDIDQLAEDFIRELRWHVLEG